MQPAAVGEKAGATAGTEPMGKREAGITGCAAGAGGAGVEGEASFGRAAGFISGAAAEKRVGGGGRPAGGGTAWPKVKHRLKNLKINQYE